jgi:hypothetical protein
MTGKMPEEEFPCKKGKPLKLPKPPARASEGFLSTIAQGMWAEEKLREAINSTQEFIAIKYGQSRYNHELISSKDAWKEYVAKVYEQMSKYGKRPDLLVFRRTSYISSDLPEDISERDEEDIKDIVFGSIAGIECRSSSYYHDKYVKERGADDKELSITVKDEDIDRLIKWRDTYCGSKPIYYVQLFFDKGFFISFDKILSIIERAKSERVKYYRHEMEKKTGKMTYYIGVPHTKVGLIATENPTITAKPIEAWDGKIYAIRTPEGGKFRLTDEFIQELLLL